MVRNVLLVMAAVTIAGCTAMQQQKSGAAAPAAAQSVPLYKNLQVLPKDITRDELRATMRGYARGLGVHCDHCHAAGTGDELDFASDAKREKNMARLMIRMARAINHDYLLKVTESETSINCWTCHRGKTEPDPEPPPPPTPMQGAAPAPPAP